MNLIQIFIVRFKIYVFLGVFFISSYLGLKANALLVDFLVDEFYFNDNWIKYLGLMINLLTIVLFVYLSLVLITKIEGNFKKKLIVEIEIGYSFFLQSLQKVENLSVLPFFVFNYTQLYRFLHNEFLIELKSTKEKLFEIYWYKKGTNELISQRTITYKNEPTIQDALIKGP
jgi:hypothetical protein